MGTLEQKTKTVIVIGAGAAGLMAAYSAAKNGHTVTIYEKNEKAGKKIYITGKGRCNITNACETEELFQNIISNKKFLYSAFYEFDNQSVIDFFEEYGLVTKVERGNRVFPQSDKSSDVIATLLKALRKHHVNIQYSTEVSDLLVEEGIVKGILLSDGTKAFADAVIMATGGLSYPVTGSDGKGMQILERHGHSIKEPTPALVPMNVKEEYCKELQGLSLKNVQGSFYLSSKPNKKPVYQDFGEMLFTHFGISGPIVLSASSYLAKELKKESIIFILDLKPALSMEQLDDRILREFEQNINKNFNNALDALLPKKLIPIIIEYCKINPYKKVNEISKKERLTLVTALKEFTMTVTSLRGYNEAIITQGGIKVKEINPSTMESKLISGLYIVGEMIDVDALTGGFNLQVAWSTGYLAGNSIE